MADYKEESIAVKRWQRVARVGIEHPAQNPCTPQTNQPPRLTFIEEIAQLAGADLSTTLCDSLTVVFEPTKQFTRSDGSIMTHQEFYDIVNDLYVYERTNRDNRLSAPPTP